MKCIELVFIAVIYSDIQTNTNLQVHGLIFQGVGTIFYLFLQARNRTLMINTKNTKLEQKKIFTETKNCVEFRVVAGKG